MKKTVIALLIAAALSALFAVCACAEDGISYMLSSDGKYYILSAYTGNEPEVRIPEEYGGLPVGAIASGAFSGSVSTYKLVIPESVKTIEDGAFSAMPSLYEFEAKGNYTSVGGALYSADKKTLVRYPQARTGDFTVPSNVNIGAHAFSGCRLTSIDLSGAVQIGKYAFYASDIRSAVFSSSLERIGENAFEKSALEKIILKGKTVISAYAFAGCEKLVYADISGASLVGEGAFCGDTSLIAVSFPQDQKSVPGLTFAGCTSLVTAPIGKSVTEIKSKAFYGCAGLEHASCGGASVASDAFGLCDKLTSDKKTYSAQKQKSAKITLKVKGTYTPDGGDESDIFTSSHNVSVYNGKITALYEGEADVYVVSRRGGDCALLQITVSNGEAVVGSDHPYEKGTFRYTYSVPGSPERIAVTFSPSDMLSSGDAIKIQDKNGNLYGTFYGSSLAGKTLFIEGDTLNITLISVTGGGYGFRVTSAVSSSSLSAVKSISLPASLDLSAGEKAVLSPAVVPSDAFPDELIFVTGNKSVADVTKDGVVYAISAGTAEITVYSAAYGVSAKCTVTVTANESDFEYEIKNNRAYVIAYKGADGVCTVPDTLGGSNVCGINDLAFAFCAVTELYLPKTVSYFSPSATDGCSSLTGIYVPDDCAAFRTVNGALYSKDGKTLMRVPCGVKGEFTVPDGVDKISDGAFSCCFGLESVVIGSSVEIFSGKAFLNCTNLKKITSNSAGFTAVDGVLYSSDKKTLIYFPAGRNVSAYSVINTAERIGAEAFNSAVYLKSIVLPASVSYIDATALREALYVETVTVNSANTVFSVNGGALYENNDLKFVPKNVSGVFTVKIGVSKILPYAFYGCSRLNEIELKGAVTEIGERAFAYCPSLDALYLPQTVKSIGYDAFGGDDNLSVYIPDGAKISYLSCCRVLCGKDGQAAAYCAENGVDFEYIYRSDYGLYTVYSPVKAELCVTEEKDPVLLTKFSTALGQNVKAFSVYLKSDGVELPAGQYVLFREPTSSPRYFYENGELLKIGQDAKSRYRNKKEYIIEPDGVRYTESLTVRTMPDKTEYYIYDTFDSGGLTLYYTNGRGITVAVDKNFTVNCDLKTPGEKTVTVSYNGVFTMFKVNVSVSVLSGAVKITGTGRYGGTLTADLSLVKPSDSEPVCQWYKNGVKIDGAEDVTYKPVKEDIGSTVTVRVKSKGGVEGELESEGVTVSKAASPAPPKPVVKTAEDGKVTLQAVDGCEYRLSLSGGFGDSNVFEGLQPGQTYVFCQRYKETLTTEASDISSISYTVPEEEKIISVKYFINTANGIVSLIGPGTSVKELRAGFKNGEKLKISKDGKELSDTDTVGTGCEIRLEINGKVCDVCTAVITGDVNGDGRITITDYLKIKERIQSGKALSKEKEYASDVNGDGKVTITDYLRLKYCIQNDVKPEQNRY